MALARAVGVTLGGIVLLLLFMWWWVSGRAVPVPLGGAAWLAAAVVAVYLVALLVARLASGLFVSTGGAVGLAGLSVVTVFAVLGAAFMAADGFNAWESRDKFLMRQVTTTQRALEWSREAEGRYPTDVSEDPGVQMQVDRIKADCAGLGHEVAEVRLAGGEATGEEERRELLVASDRDGKLLVVIYADGTYGLSRRLLTRRARAVPQQVEILR